MIIWDNLSAMQMDVLKEIGNIGAGHAATSFAQMVQRTVKMSVPSAGLMPLEKVYELVGSEEEKVACVNFVVKGEAPAQIIFLISKGAFLMVDLLLGKELGSTKGLDAMGESVLQETGNILASSFLNAFAEFVGMKFIPSVPAFAFDMLGAVLSSALLESGLISDQVLVIEAQLFSEDVSIECHFFLLPQAEALDRILQALGVN